MKYRTRKYRKNLKKRTRKIRRFRRKRIGGHDNEDLPHYHLFVKLPNGQTREMFEVFERSRLDRQVDSATINDIKNFVNDCGITEPFTLFWKGKKLEDNNVKLRQIVVEGTKLPLYHPNADNPIVVVLNKDIGDPINFEAHDLDLEDIRAPQTPR
jgi:hypothetical protein